MRRTLFILLPMLCLATAAGPALAGGPTTTTAAPSAEAAVDPSRELLVLLARDRAVAKPEDVVAMVRHGQALPASLGLGTPDHARWLIPEPDRSAESNLDPDSPGGLLNRYIVLSYPLPIDKPALLQSMMRNRNIRYACENRLLHVSVIPNDPLFQPPPIPFPDQYQWGSYSLHLPEAWDYNKGHSYVGVIDTGLDVQHPDLRAFHQDEGGHWVFDHGNYRPQFACDYAYTDEGQCPGEFAVDPSVALTSVDEGQPEFVATSSTLSCPDHICTPMRAGHGTHVSGIIAATANNGTDVAGACWSCSLIVSKVSVLIHKSLGWENTGTLQTSVIAGLKGAILKGAQVINMSLGYRTGDPEPPPDCGAHPDHPFCLALQLAQDRDVVLVAAAGNDFNAQPDFPASDARAIGVAGIDPAGNLWNDCAPTSSGCGSNYSPEMIEAPAKQVLSTFYRTLPYGGSTCPGNAETGPCTGTSMASPYIAGSAGVLRSVNPLLNKDDIKTLLTTNLDNPPGWNPANGKGKPNIGVAVRAAQGVVHGTVIPNRLTPLFSLYSANVEDFLYTTAPQMAASALLNVGAYLSSGPEVNGYSNFPGVSVVFPGIDVPTASVYIFTGDRTPYPGAPPLVPLYRLTFKGTNPNGNPIHRDTTYTTADNGVIAFKQAGYELDGIEGYIYAFCTPEPTCIPPGAVRLFRRYNFQRDDFAIFPESELPSMVSQGYTSTGGSNLNEVIGYVYPNLDSDGDNLIDGFELLLGTNPQRRDSDCDGIQDGVEVLGFPANDPLGGSGCIPPVARFSFTCTGLTCSFDGGASTDNVGITDYAWSFGAHGAAVGHPFGASGSYTVTLTVTDTDGLTGTLSKVVNVTSENYPLAAPKSYFALTTPCRLFDTRSTTDPVLAGGGILTSDQIRQFLMTGRCGVPSDAKAVAVNVTAITATDRGNFQFYPGDLPSGITPAASLNFGTNNRANNAIVRLATNNSGTLTLKPFVASSGQVHMVMDVNGYFSESVTPAPGSVGPLGFQPLNPCRFVDSSGLIGGIVYPFSVQGSCGVPFGAAAASLLLTVAQPSANGNVVLYPNDLPVFPGTSTINFLVGTSLLTNSALTRLAATTPDLAFRYSFTGATLRAMIDTNGYFKSDALLKYHPILPCRAIDTRSANQGAPALSNAVQRNFQVQGNCGVPAGAKAVFLNVTAWLPTATGSITAFAGGSAAPSIPSVNFDASDPVLGNGVIVPLGTTVGQDLALLAKVPPAGSVDAIVDVFGYFQ